MEDTFSWNCIFCMNRKVIIIKFNYRGIVGISCFIVLISTAVLLRSRWGSTLFVLNSPQHPRTASQMRRPRPLNSTKATFQTTSESKPITPGDNNNQSIENVNEKKCHSQWLIQWRTMEWNCITDWQCASERNDNNEPITWANYLIVVKRINFSKRLANCIENGSAIVLQVIHSASESTCGASILRRNEYQFNLSDNLCQSRAQCVTLGPSPSRNPSPQPDTFVQFSPFRSKSKVHSRWRTSQPRWLKRSLITPFHTQPIINATLRRLDL